MLCIAAEADPTGYVLVNGRTPTTTDLARMTGEPEAVIQSALEELDRNGVFSRDRKDRIYSRRIVRDEKTSEKNRKNGRGGGNPTLWAESEKPRPLKPPDKPPDKAKRPEARVQIHNDAGASLFDATAPPGEAAAAGRRANGATKRRSGVEADWQPDPELRAEISQRGHDEPWIADQIGRFRDYHRAKGNLFASKDAAFRNWVRNAEDFAARDRRPNGFAGASASQPGPISAAVHAIRNRRNLG